MQLSQEKVFRYNVRQGRKGWNVDQHQGGVRLRIREGVPAKVIDRFHLPYAWNESEFDNALAYIRELYQCVYDQQGQRVRSLKEASEKVSLVSSDLKKRASVTMTWKESSDDFKRSLIEGRNQIKETTWRDNYLPYISYAIELLESKNKPKDGYELLREVIAKWKDYPSSRFACCIALRGWMDLAVKRHNIPISYLIDRLTVKELRGKAPDKKDKFVFTDQEILDFIDAVEKKDPRWANVIRVMSLYGVRPVELGNIEPRFNDDGKIQMYCTYRKVSGENKTDARWLEIVPLQNKQGEKVSWDLAQQMYEGNLEFPVSKTGEPYEKFDAITVRNFLRYFPEWLQLKKKYAPRFQVKPYAFRDSWITRATAMGIPDPIICRAVGHGLITHSRNYQLATDRTTRKAFEEIRN